jgi:hypothetical protein
MGPNRHQLGRLRSMRGQRHQPAASRAVAPPVIFVRRIVGRRVEDLTEPSSGLARWRTQERNTRSGGPLHGRLGSLTTCCQVHLSSAPLISSERLMSNRASVYSSGQAHRVRTVSLGPTLTGYSAYARCFAIYGSSAMGFADKAKEKIEELKGKVKDVTGMATGDDREGVSAADTTPSGPHGVGMSTSTSGNEPSLTDSEESHHEDRIDAGVSHEQNVAPGSPPMPSGDQGG